MADPSPHNRSLSFRARLGGRLAILVALLALIGTTALLGLLRMRHHFDAATDSYSQLRSVYDVGHRAALLRVLIHAAPRDDRAIADALDVSSLDLASLESSGAHLRTRLGAIEPRLRTGRDVTADLDAILGEVTALAGQLKGSIVEQRAHAARQVRSTAAIVAALLIVGLWIAIWIGIAQYRSVMGPIGRLAKGVQNVAQGDLSTRVDESGDAEFRLLFRRFNDMTATLDRLTSAMENEVQAKSRQLIRSEQLASVGVLAAGFAHEINNPLGIIAGYAESTLRTLDALNGHAGPAVESARQALSIINDEAFRCRDITRELLGLARSDDGRKVSVDISSVARRVIDILTALPAHRGKTVDLHADDPALVLCHQGQLTQVLLNLLTNALEAVSPGRGHIEVSITATDRVASITFRDNGRGMNSQALRSAFDPFWTDKHRRGEPGTGLGLSVSHAIIGRHGGGIFAHSDGPGTGSTFRVELPLAPATQETGA